MEIRPRHAAVFRLVFVSKSYLPMRTSMKIYFSMKATDTGSQHSPSLFLTRPTRAMLEKLSSSKGSGLLSDASALAQARVMVDLDCTAITQSAPRFIPLYHDFGCVPVASTVDGGDAAIVAIATTILKGARKDVVSKVLRAASRSRSRARHMSPHTDRAKSGTPDVMQTNANNNFAMRAVLQNTDSIKAEGISRTPDENVTFNNILYVAVHNESWVAQKVTLGSISSG